MRTSFVAIGAAFIAAAALFPTSAGATTNSQAAALCKNNPNCQNMGGGSYCLGKNCSEHVITCPPKGNCTVVYLQPGGGKKRFRGNVGTLLTTSAPAKPTKPVTGAGVGPKVKTTGQQPNKVVRDHRSQPVLHDHRSQPIVRDHRMAGDHRGPVPNRK